MFAEFSHAYKLPTKTTKPVWVHADNVGWFDVEQGYVRVTLVSGNVLHLETTPEEFMAKTSHAERFALRNKEDR